MMLCDNLYSKVIFLYVNLRCVAHGCHKSSLYLGSRVVSVVKNTELRVSAFAVKVKFSVFLLVKVHAPFNELFYLFRCISDNLLHSFAVTDIVACNHGVFNVLFKVVHLEVCY